MKNRSKGRNLYDLMGIYFCQGKSEEVLQGNALKGEPYVDHRQFVFEGPGDSSYHR